MSEASNRDDCIVDGLQPVQPDAIAACDPIRKSTYAPAILEAHGVPDKAVYYVVAKLGTDLTGARYELSAAAEMPKQISPSGPSLEGTAAGAGLRGIRPHA